MSGCLRQSDCLNGGKCQFDENDADFLQPGHVAKRPAKCQCKDGFMGQYCQSGIEDPTCKTDAECLNGGSCLLANGKRKQDEHDFLEPGSEKAYCQCTVGFTGNKCHVRDYDIEIEYPAKVINDVGIEYPGKAMEENAITGIALGALVAIIAVFWLLVKGVGGTSRGMAPRRRQGAGQGDGIAMTSAGLRKRRGAKEVMDVGPVLTPSGGEMI